MNKSLSVHARSSMRVRERTESLLCHVRLYAQERDRSVHYSLFDFLQCFDGCVVVICVCNVQFEERSVAD